MKFTRKRTPIAERLFAKVASRNSGECWNWTGKSNKRGYGEIWCCDRQKMISTHRVSYEIHCGPIPNGLVVRHRCDNPSCVNPQHLELGTQADNVNDRQLRGRFVLPNVRGERMGSSKLTEATVLKIRDMYSSGEWTLRALGKEFGVTNSNISSIVSRKTWTHI